MSHELVYRNVHKPKELTNFETPSRLTRTRRSNNDDSRWSAWLIASKSDVKHFVKIIGNQVLKSSVDV